MNINEHFENFKMFFKYNSNHQLSKYNYKLSKKYNCWCVNDLQFEIYILKSAKRCQMIKSYCLGKFDCVTNTGDGRIYFGSAIKLIIESSKCLAYFREQISKNTFFNMLYK